MNALLIGFGDLASRLAPRLVDAGWSVTGLRRRQVDVPGVEMVAGDCRDSALLTRLLPGQDLVVVTLTPGEYSEAGYRESYVEGALALAAALAADPVRPARVIWVSSTSVYGQHQGEWVDERTPTEPGSFSGRLLLEAESAVQAADAPATVVRFSGIYGPGRDRTIQQVKKGRSVPATPVKWTNRIHSEDCAGVLHHIAHRDREGEPVAPLYIGTDTQPAPLYDVQHWLAEKLGVELHEDPDWQPRRGNRRCSNALLLGSGYRFEYPTWKEGYGALLEEASP